MDHAQFRASVSATTTPLSHFWEHTVGSCHALLALRADWQAQMRRCHDELGFRHVRFHGLLSDDLGTLICHQEKPLYSFFNVDQIVDFLLSIGMKPFVELSFMPKALASGGKTVFRYQANVTPPKALDQWADLIGKLVSHWVERYGEVELREWYFEVWNEPNLANFWTGTRDDYFLLYRRTAMAIKAVDSALKVGGPATAKNEWIEEFLDFGDKNKVPVDFISTHHYPTDAFGNETDDTQAQLAKATRSVLREQAQGVRRRARGRPVYYTEWNTSSNPRDPLHDEPYAAAFVVKTVMEMNGLVEGYSFWTFSDIFDENYFPSVPFHGGFGLLNLHGIPKPTYRAFELLHRLGDELTPIDGSHESVDAWVIGKDGSVTVLLTNHALPRHPIRSVQVHVELAGAQEPCFVCIERIDETHANAKSLWQGMGEPEYLSRAQVECLEEASRLCKEPQPWDYQDGAIHLDITLPPFGVAAVTLGFVRDRVEGGA